MADRLIPGSKEYKRARIEQLRRMADGLEPIVMPTPNVDPEKLSEKDKYNLEVAEKITERWRQHSAVRDGVDCPICKGRGVIAERVTDDSERRNRLVPCPHPDCPVVRRDTAERVARMKKLSRIPAIYSDYTLESWMRTVTDVEMQGKSLALALAHYYVEHFGQPFHMHQALDDLGVPYQVIEPNFGSRDKREHKYRLVVELDGKKVVLPDSTGNSLGFIGNFGLGKSGMAAGIANALIDRGHYVVFIRLSDFIQKIQNTYADDYEGESVPDMVRPLALCDLLIVDEFGVTGEKASADKQKIVQDYVVNPRWSKRPPRPLIFTTNHTDLTFFDQWDGQIATRIFEMAHVIEFGGMPLRADNR